MLTYPCRAGDFGALVKEQYNNFLLRTVVGPDDLTVRQTTTTTSAGAIVSKGLYAHQLQRWLVSETNAEKVISFLGNASG